MTNTTTRALRALLASAALLMAAAAFGCGHKDDTGAVAPGTVQKGQLAPLKGSGADDTTQQAVEKEGQTPGASTPAPTGR